MAKLRSFLGEETSERLMKRRSLKRVRTPDGKGDAYTGPAATRALKALGARAMTVDQSVILPEDFDPNRPEHAALYAHEAFHVQEARRGASTRASHAVHDAEEVGARAVESMVLHHMSADGDRGGVDAGAAIHRAVDSGGGAVQGGGEGAAPAGAASGGGPEAVYAQLQSQGLSHHEIVERLARYVLDALDERREGDSQRGIPAARSLG